MTAVESGITTAIARHDLHHIWVGGMDLTSDIMGHLSFTEVVWLLVAGKLPASKSDSACS